MFTDILLIIVALLVGCSLALLAQIRGILRADLDVGRQLLHLQEADTGRGLLRTGIGRELLRERLKERLNATSQN